MRFLQFLSLLMKRALITIWLGAMACTSQSQNRHGIFSLRGKVNYENTGKVFLYYADKNGQHVKDSAFLKDGSFVFTGSIGGPTSAWLEGNVKSRDVNDPNATELFLEPKHMSITLTVNDFKHAVITG